MQHVLELRKYDLVGIVNGIDYDSWDSQTDQYLVRNYSLETIESKKANKLALQAQFALPQDENVLLIGIVSRLTWQRVLPLDRGTWPSSSSPCPICYLRQW